MDNNKHPGKKRIKDLQDLWRHNFF